MNYIVCDKNNKIKRNITAVTENIFRKKRSSRIDIRLGIRHIRLELWYIRLELWHDLGC